MDKEVGRPSNIEKGRGWHVRAWEGRIWFSVVCGAIQWVCTKRDGWHQC